MTDLEHAKAYLSSHSTLKCVLCKQDTHYESEKRGVAPMMDFLASGIDLCGFSAADRVVGRGAAFLFVLAGVTSVHGEVMSRGACEVFGRFGIENSFDRLVDHIINREGTGMCPIESAVWEITNPQEAYRAIKARLSALRSAKQTEA